MRPWLAGWLLLAAGGCASGPSAPPPPPPPPAAAAQSALWLESAIVGAESGLADDSSLAGPATVIETPQLGVPLPPEYGARPLAIAAHDGTASAVTQPAAADLLSSIVPAPAVGGTLEPRWPKGFSGRAPSQAERRSQVIALAADRTEELYAAVYVEPRRRDLAEYAAARRAARLHALQAASATDIAQMRVGTHAACQFELESSAQQVTLLETVIEGRAALVTVTVWTPSAQARRHSDRMRALASELGIR